MKKQRLEFLEAVSLSLLTTIIPMFLHCNQKRIYLDRIIFFHKQHIAHKKSEFEHVLGLQSIVICNIVEYFFGLEVL